MSSKDSGPPKKRSLSMKFENGGCPLVMKKSRILMAAINNDVEILKSLLDSPKWYKVRDGWSRDLVHVTILENSKEAFDYLLSLADFPIDASVRSIISTMLTTYNYDDYYLFELVKRGADIGQVSKVGNTILHFATAYGLTEFAKFLTVERGVDVNAPNNKGETPLHWCYYCRNQNQSEVISVLLCCGADPFVRNDKGDTPLEMLLETWPDLVGDDSYTGQTNLVYYTLDQWSECKIPASFLFKLVRKKSPVFEALVASLTDKTIDNDVHWAYVVDLFVMKTEQIELLVEKLPFLVTEMLYNHADYDNSPFNFGFHSLFQVQYCKSISLKNFDIIGRNLPSVLSDFVAKLNSTKLIDNLIEWSCKSKSEIIKMILYMLSYGMTLREIDFEVIYKKLTGYDDNFKVILQMDAQKDSGKGILHTMTRLIVDVTLNVEGIVADTDLCSKMDWNVLFGFFAHPKLQQAHRRIKGQKFGNLPQVPSLQELARDAFRQHFIKKFKIRTAKQFFSLIKFLPISPGHEKIITFETKLYNHDG